MRTSILALVLVVLCSIVFVGAYYYITLYEAEAQFVDPTGDLFDKNGNTVTGESYLDIVESEALLANNTYTVKIRVDGALPTDLADPSIFIEWDILIDSDLDPGTGWNWSLISNDIGPDHLLRLMLMNGSVFQAGNLRTELGIGGWIGYQVNESIIELDFPKEVIGSPTSFNYVIAVRKYGEEGAPSALLVADKAPQQGHYVLHAHYVEVEPPKGLKMLRTAHAVIFYCILYGQRAEEIAGGFELAYAYILEDFPVCPAQNFTIYIYRSQSELVEGLKIYSYIPPEMAEFFRRDGAPRPVNYVMHVPPGMGWDGVAHELTHTFIEEFSGNAYKQIKWLDEGIAQYEAYRFAMGTHYRWAVEEWRKNTTSVVYKLLDQEELFALEDISTEQQFYDLWVKGYINEIYSQAFAVVEYLCQTYGLDKCLNILKFMQEGEAQEQAVQSALGVSIQQIEIDFRNHLQGS